MQEDNAQAHSRRTRTARFFNQVHRCRNVLQRRWWVLPIGMAVGLGIQAYRIWSAPAAFVSIGRMIVSVKIQTKMGSSYSEPLLDFLGTQAALMKSSTVQNRAIEWLQGAKP